MKLRIIHFFSFGVIELKPKKDEKMLKKNQIWHLITLITLQLSYVHAYFIRQIEENCFLEAIDTII